VPGSDQSLSLPANTLLFRAAGLQVATVDSSDHVHLKTIVPGRDFGKSIEVVSGLAADDSVVVNPPDSLIDGAARAHRAAAETRIAGAGREKNLVRWPLAQLALVGVAVPWRLLACAGLQETAHRAARAVLSGGGRLEAGRACRRSSRGPWWGVFQDPVLDALENRVSASNQNLKAALARLEEARAQTRIARAGYFPTITADANAARERQSINSPTYNTLKPGAFNDFQLEGDFSYEIDVFGRVRKHRRFARATQQASAADLAVLDLSTHAELATDYFTLRSDDAQASLLDHTVADYAQALQLTENLYNGGAAPLSDLEQARAQLETAKTQAADIRLRRAQTEHAIAVLIGEQASTFHIDPTPLSADTAPPAVDPGLPSALLERRPDVAGAERLVAAANARIGWRAQRISPSSA